MPLGPKELFDKLTEADKVQYDKLCREIDEGLLKFFSGAKETIISLSESPNIRVERRITAAYVTKGWAALKFDYEQKDGAYVVMKYDGSSNQRGEMD